MVHPIVHQKKPCQKKPGSSIQYINSQPPAPFFVMISSEAWWLGGSYRTPVTTPVLQHGRECRRRRYGAGARRGAFGGRKTDAAGAAGPGKLGVVEGSSQKKCGISEGTFIKVGGIFQKILGLEPKKMGGRNLLIHLPTFLVQNVGWEGKKWRGKLKIL